MSKYSGQQIDFITEQNVYDYRSITSIGKGYDSITELHFNASNGSAKGTDFGSIKKPLFIFGYYVSY